MGYRSAGIGATLVLASLIAACGGGGGGSGGSAAVFCGSSEMNAKPCGPAVSFTPQPTLTASKTALTPLPATPATTSGSYDTIAHLRTGNEQGATQTALVAPDALRIQVDAATRTYSVQISRAGLPATGTFQLDPEFGNHVTQTDTWSDGRQTVNEWDATNAGAAGQEKPRTTTLPHAESTNLSLSTGTSHVALGSWALDQLTVDANNNYTYDQRLATIYFVFGDRTLASDMPASGSATYKLDVANSFLGFDRFLANSLSGGQAIDASIQFTLTADFAARTMNVLFDSKPDTYSGDYGTIYYWGIVASGSAPFTAGTAFDIPVTGTMSSIEPKAIDKSLPVTGEVTGAFFGPQAAEVGGTFSLQSLDGRFNAFGEYASPRVP